MGKFYVRTNTGELWKRRFATAEEAWAFARMLHSSRKPCRVGHVIPRREREARDALVAAALAWAGTDCPIPCSHRLCAAARAYRKVSK
jgi:hypothetical protein